jgi:HSP20 family protein
MTLTKFSGNDFPSIVNRFFDKDLMDWSNSNFAGLDSTLPAVNVKETENDFQIEVAAPGMKKDDFKLSYENGQLTISAEFDKEERGSSKEKYLRREYRYRSFQRSFTIQENMVESAGIDAKYLDGILSITLPKREELKPKPAREIKIS